MHRLTVVFDLDGTLIDTAPDLIGALNHTMAALGVPASPDHLMRREISHGARHMIVAALATAGRTLPADEVERIFRDYLAHYADNIARASRPYPGLEPALSALAERGARLAVCTNKSEALARKLLDELGLGGRFCALTGWDTFPFYKPHPYHLIRTIEMAGGDPARSIMVGDSATDIKTARAASVPVIGVPFGYTAVPIHDLGPDLVVEHYDDLLAAIAQLHTR